VAPPCSPTWSTPCCHPARRGHVASGAPPRCYVGLAKLALRERQPLPSRRRIPLRMEPFSRRCVRWYKDTVSNDHACSLWWIWLRQLCPILLHIVKKNWICDIYSSLLWCIIYRALVLGVYYTSSVRDSIFFLKDGGISSGSLWDQARICLDTRKLIEQGRIW
jgi:hypothetical protein